MLITKQSFSEITAPTNVVITDLKCAMKAQRAPLNEECDYDLGVIGYSHVRSHCPLEKSHFDLHQVQIFSLKMAF